MKTLPHTAGICLKPQHYEALLKQPYSTGWLEIHPENYMGKGGAPHAYLHKLRERHPLSMHGVGLSLGSADGIDSTHLAQLKTLVNRYQPEQVSEHLSWSHWQNAHLNDLLPLPYTHESLTLVCENIDLVQQTIGRQILIENPSSYIDFQEGDFSETEFLNTVAARSGCGILLDINNVYVSAFNNDFSPTEYLNQITLHHVHEIHLAGHSLKPLVDNKHIRIDDHGSPVKDEVWELYGFFIARAQRRFPTLIEWDTDIPTLDILLHEAELANTWMHQSLTQDDGGIELCR